MTTTATSVPFGAINVATPYQGCQKVSISTNAAGGYTIATKENHALRTGSGSIIPDANCNADGCLNTPTTAAAWTIGSAQGFGISCVHSSTSQSCSTSDPNWNNGVNWAPAGNESLGIGSGRFSGLSSNTGVEVITKSKFRLYAPSTQGAGTYTNLVEYIVTPVF